MNITRLIVMLVGVAILLVGAYLLYFEAGLNQWVSIGIVTAGVLLVIGVAVMMFAGSAQADPVRNTTAAPQNAQPTTVVQDNRPVTQRNTPR